MPQSSSCLSLWRGNSRGLQIQEAMLHIDLCGHALLTAKVWVSFFSSLAWLLPSINIAAQIVRSYFWTFWSLLNTELLTQAVRSHDSGPQNEKAGLSMEILFYLLFALLTETLEYFWITSPSTLLQNWRQIFNLSLYLPVIHMVHGAGTQRILPNALRQETFFACPPKCLLYQ